VPEFKSSNSDYNFFLDLSGLQVQPLSKNNYMPASILIPMVVKCGLTILKIIVRQRVLPTV